MTTLARAPRGREIAAFATIATASALAAARPLPCLATDDGRAPQPSEPPPRREHEHEHGQEEDTPDELPPAAAHAEDELPASLGNRCLSALGLYYAGRFGAADDDETPLYALLEMTYGGPYLAAAVDAIATSELDGPAIADALLDGFVHILPGGDAQRAEVYAFLDAAAAVVRAGAEGAAFEALERGEGAVPDGGALHVPLVTLALLFEPSDRPRWLYAFEALRALAAYLRDEQRFGLVAIHVIVAISEARLGLRGAR